jgi:cytochrome c-type biogenesis protein
LFATPFLAWMQRNRQYLGYVEKVMGVLLILFAVLIVTNSLNYIAQFMLDAFDWSKVLK